MAREPAATTLTPTMFFALTITLLGGYMAVNALWSKEFTRLQRGGARLAIHAIGCSATACAGAIALLILERSFHFGAAYLLMPLLYLTLLMSASALTRRLHGRLLLPANRYNMGHADMREARFSDYALFMVVHFVPLLVPPFVFETLLSVPV